MTDAAFTTPPLDQPPTAPGPRPEARRSGTDRMAGGVCGGLADYSGVDAVLWRVGFVAASPAMIRLASFNFSVCSSGLAACSASPTRRCTSATAAGTASPCSPGSASSPSAASCPA